MVVLSKFVPCLSETCGLLHAADFIGGKSDFNFIAFFVAFRSSYFLISLLVLFS